MLSDAHGQTAEMNARMRQTLAPVKAELGTQHRQMAKDAEKMMAGIRKDVTGLKAEASQVVADAASMMNGLAKASRERAAAWRDVLRTVSGNGQGAPAARTSAATAVMKPPTKAKPKAKAKGKKKTQAKKR